MNTIVSICSGGVSYEYDIKRFRPWLKSVYTDALRFLQINICSENADTDNLQTI